MYLFQPERVNVPGQVTCIYIPPCIYFNHAPSQNQAVFLLTFTFHYVSISTLGNPTPSAVSIKFTFHYVSISTDCWLNRKSECVGLTFHYVSISTRSDVHGSVGECLFTFHYVSISTNSKEDNKRLLSIYIPLCIYFNLFPNKPNPFFTQFTFHYVSISTFTAHFISDIVTCIYIPLPIMIRCIPIYIPLCIYFNLRSLFIVHFLLVFTFHYVSISTGETVVSTPLLLAFTFHYVSISTIVDIQAVVVVLDLHSTMYLFQQNRIWTVIREKIFTFHYVSISTIVLLIKHSLHWFTFHYVSISTWIASTVIMNVILIYIPLCIYFNGGWHIITPLKSMIYIPLCIYFNFFTSQFFQFLKLIYIPLCIYFNHILLSVNLKREFIYIPLCIYFNHLQLKLM